MAVGVGVTVAMAVLREELLLHFAHYNCNYLSGRIKKAIGKLELSLIISIHNGSDFD